VRGDEGVVDGALLVSDPSSDAQEDEYSVRDESDGLGVDQLS
jgi:hypothetical protein